MTNIEEEDKSFDAVVVFGVLHHIPQWRIALKEISRVLKPDGILLIEEPKLGFTWPEFDQGIEACNFTILENRQFLFSYFSSYLCRKTHKALV